MRNRTTIFSHAIWVVAAALAVSLAASVGLAGRAPLQPKRAAIVQPVPCSYAPGTPDLGCLAPPQTFSAAPLNGTSLGQAWDAWAWSTFAALNWPALAGTGAAYPSGFVRGVPDASRSFVTAQSTDVTVWETFKEKRELFNQTATAASWQQLTFDPEYAPDFNGGKIQMCGGTDMTRLASVRRQPRIFARISKVATGGGLNTGDETAEVASPAQESTNQLCAGLTSQTRPTLAQCQSYLYPPPAANQFSTPYSATGPNGRNPVGPRVFKGTPAQDHFLYYEVKLNYDYFAYLAANNLNDYSSAVVSASKNTIRLPYRTSALAGPGSKNTASVLGYDAGKTAACYASKLQNCSVPNQSGISPTHLPGLGSIQLKAAWVPAAQLDGDPSTYHLTDAVYYKDAPGQPNNICYAVQTFGLVGLHIIQRVHAGNPGQAQGDAPGGTYIFATWEHQSVGNGAAYSYVNYSKFANNTEMPFPNSAAGIQVARLKPYPLPTTQGITSAVQAQLSGSVWKNYRLIGTQFLAMNLGNSASTAAAAEKQSLAIGQPIYLANLLIETNRGLQQFQGQPPGQAPNTSFGMNGVPKNYQFFSPTSPNMTSGGSAQNMGGCMGCHGVAQTQGFAFSFVLQDGNRGTVPDTGTSIAIPPVAPPPTPPGDVCSPLIFNNATAASVCRPVCASVGLAFGGNWSNVATYPPVAQCINSGKGQSVCGCVLPPR